ncbi:MAG: hypothetical protein RMY33_025100 [Nostoc sp. DedQUE03]
MKINTAVLRNIPILHFKYQSLLLYSYATAKSDRVYHQDLCWGLNPHHKTCCL